MQLSAISHEPHKDAISLTALYYECGRTELELNLQVSLSKPFSR